MGVGEFLSSKAHNEWVLSERERESWEMTKHPEGETAEMVEIYVERGMSLADATLVVDRMSRYPEFFVDVMMSDELQLQVPSPDHRCASFREGIIMFLSFAFFGLPPLLGYVFIPAAAPALPHPQTSSAAHAP